MSELLESSIRTPRRAMSADTPVPSIERLKLRHFRCFEHFETEFSPGFNFIIGPNARGKTSLLEAVCVLLRLQSPRATLARVIQHDRRGLVADGYFGGRHLQFYYSPERKKLALDSVEQSTAREWLKIGRVVWFGNEDIEIVRGGGEQRRRFLDFVATQRTSSYQSTLRSFQHALRSRNNLLKQPSPNWREIAAFDGPLIEHGNALTQARMELTASLESQANPAHAAISGRQESLAMRYVPGGGEDFTAALIEARAEDARLRQTTVGPHRDDVVFALNGISSDDASEGQQRTLVLALKVAASRLLENQWGVPPVLLMDDIFGELDPDRRNALLGVLPESAQKIITTTQLQWMPARSDSRILDLGCQ